jgi:hypothetical protein
MFQSQETRFLDTRFQTSDYVGAHNFFHQYQLIHSYSQTPKPKISPVRYPLSPHCGENQLLFSVLQPLYRFPVLFSEPES